MDIENDHGIDLRDRDSGTSRTRRNAAIGLTAGLLGGGAIGLLMTVPSLTSAASDDGDPATAAAAVALQDDGTVDDGTVDDGTVDDGTVDAPPLADRPEPGVALREVLQGLVDDGTLTSDQADAVADYLVANRPEFDGPHGPRDRGPGHPGMGGPGADGEVIAGLLGIDVETLRTELRAGTSIADLAEANGVDEQSVIDALVDEAESHLELAVENGRLTEDEAAQRLDQLTERITARVNGERPVRD
jgi:polyhydroxyalkanoate synthesis regulator phasin